MSETPDTQPQSMAPGQILKRAREGKNLTLAAIATLMNLDLRTVEALERGNQSELPAPIFVRGYLRGYARLVGVDEATVLEAYQAQAPQEPRPRPVGMSRVPVRPAFRAPAISLKTVFSVILLLVFAWVGVEWGPDLIARVSGDAAQETAAVVDSALVPTAEQATSDAEQVAPDAADDGPRQHGIEHGIAGIVRATRRANRVERNRIAVARLTNTATRPGSRGTTPGGPART